MNEMNNIGPRHTLCRGMYDFFSLGGINNEIPEWTNDSMRLKDASRIKDKPEGNITCTIFLKPG